MAVLGVGGELQLTREAPAALVLSPYAIDGASNTIAVRDNAYWTGDFIRLTCANGLPIDTASNGPDAPNGYAMYFGSRWYRGYNKQHVTSADANYYQPVEEDSDDFYARPEVTGLTTALTYFIYRDQLDRLSFYATRDQALAGSTANRIDLFDVDITSFIISAAGNSTYNTELDNAADDIQNFTPPEDGELSLDTIVDVTLDPVDSLNNSAWLVQAQLREWTLNLSAPEVDTTALGERFGDSVKSIITGGGQMDFLIERRVEAADAQEPSVLLNLLLLTQRGSKAKAKFYMIQDRAARFGLLPGSLYYETELLVTSEAINVRPDDIIAGSLDFVTVGDIKLRMASV